MTRRLKTAGLPIRFTPTVLGLCVRYVVILSPLAMTISKKFTFHLHFIYICSTLHFVYRYEQNFCSYLTEASVNFFLLSNVLV